VPQANGFAVVFDSNQQLQNGEGPLHVTALELWLPSSSNRCEFTLKTITLNAVKTTLRFDPSAFLEWDLGPSTVYLRKAGLKPALRIRSLWPTPVSVEANIFFEGRSLWRQAITLQPERWVDLSANISPERNGVCELLLLASPSGESPMPLSLHFGVDSFGEKLSKNEAFGMNTHYLRPHVRPELYGNFTRQFKELGIGWIRLGLLEDPRLFRVNRQGWSIDPLLLEPGLRVAERAGVKVLALANMLGWDEATPRVADTPREPFGDLTRWFELHLELAKALKGRVAAYELMNERDNVWRPALYLATEQEKVVAKNNPYAFYTIGEQVAAALTMRQAFKVADPTAPVVAHGTGFLLDSPGEQIQFQYNRRMMELGASRFTDVANLHLYGWLHTSQAERVKGQTLDGRQAFFSKVDPCLSPMTAGSNGLINNSLRQAMHAEAMAREFGRSGPWWVSESAQPSSMAAVYSSEFKRARWIFDPSPDRQAADVIITHAFLFSLGVEKVFWYEDTDFGLTDPGFSLYDVRFCPKPAVISYRFISQWLSGTHCVGQLPVPKNVWAPEGGAWEQCPTAFAPVFQIADGKQLAVLWTVSADTETIQVNLPQGAAEYDIFGNPLPAIPSGEAVTLMIGPTPRLLQGKFPKTHIGEKPLRPRQANTVESSTDLSTFMVTPAEVVVAKAGENVSTRLDLWSALGKEQLISLKLTLPKDSGWVVVEQPEPVALGPGRFVKGTTLIKLRAKTSVDDWKSPADLKRRPRLLIEGISSTGKSLVPILQDLVVVKP
jgi:hypothetical protein